MTVNCSICGEMSEDGGPLTCGHEFCVTCFERYVFGTIEELHSFIRCCVCGQQMPLIRELNGEPVLQRFGRETEPRLRAATGFCQVGDGCFTIVDAAAHHGYTLDSSGSSQNTFPLIYKYNVLKSIVMDNQKRTVLPVLTRDCINAFNKTRHVSLAYYNSAGQYINSAFLPTDADIKSLGVTQNNEVLCADYAKGCIHVVHEKQRYLKEIPVPTLFGDDTNSRPWGLGISPVDGRIFITDVGNNSVKIFSPEGEYLSQFGSYGERPGQFKHPTSIDIDENNRILVADTGNNRVQLFDRDGIFLRYIVRYNRDAHAYLRPTQVAFHQTIPDVVVVFLSSSKSFLELSEVRMYQSTGPPSMLSC